MKSEASRVIGRRIVKGNPPVLVAVFLGALACGSSSAEVDTDAGDADAAVLADAAAPPDAYVPPFELAPCSETPGELVSITQGNFRGMGVGPTHVYVSKREGEGVEARTNLYSAPRDGGPMTKVAEISGTWPELKSDGHHLFYYNGQWHALALDGGASGFLDGLIAHDIEARDGTVYAVGDKGSQSGLWRRPAPEGGGTQWELVAEGRFLGPLDVADGYATMSGGGWVGYANGNFVYRVDLASGEIEVWAWGRDQIGSVVADGDGVVWSETAGTYRVTAPLAQPTLMFPVGFQGVGNMQASPNHIDYVHKDFLGGHLSRYDRATTQVTDLLTVPFSIGSVMAVGRYHFFIRPGFVFAGDGPGAVFRYDASDPSTPPLEIAVPTFEPADLATDGEYVYWTDEGEFFNPGTIWRTRISDAATDKLLEVAWPRSLVMIGRVIYFTNSSGVWSFDIDDQQLVQLQQNASLTNLATDGEHVYWGAFLDSEVYRYEPGGSAPELLFGEVNPTRSMVVFDEYLYWVDKAQIGESSVWRGHKDGSQAPERLLPRLDGVFGLFPVDDLLVYSNDSRHAFLSLPKSGTGLPPSLTPEVWGLRTVNHEQWGTTAEGLVRRTPVTGLLDRVWARGDYQIRSFTVDDRHVFVLVQSQVLCITR